MKKAIEGSTNTRMWCGSQRCFYSMRIYETLKRNGMSATTIAHDLGISRQAVSRVISGGGHSERVLNALRSIGVPEKYIFDPRRVSIKKITLAA